MKRKVNLLIPIFVLLVLIYAVRSIVGPAVKTEALQRGSMENVINTKGLLVKYESVMNPGDVGSLEALVSEGARVASGQAVAAIYNSQVEVGTKNRLEQINRKIAQIEKNSAELVNFNDDISRLEQKISEQTVKMVEQSLAGDMIGVSETQLVIEALCQKKAQVSGEEGTAGNLLGELQAEKEKLEATIGAASTYLSAPMSGVFSMAIDGLETVITPYNMMELSPDGLEELLKKGRSEVQMDAANCKIIQNFRYFVAVNLPVEQLETMRVGDSANLRFYDLSGDLVPVTVLHISQEHEGEKTVIVEGNRHLDSLLKCRTVNIDFIRSRYNGYRVNVKCLHTKDDVTGVYVRREDMLKFIPVTILYNSQDAAIVDSADQSNLLRLYDEVVVSADSYEEGKLLR